MSSDRTQEQTDNSLEEFTKVDKESQELLFEEINKELEEAFLSKENNDKDATGTAGNIRPRFYRNSR